MEKIVTGNNIMKTKGNMAILNYYLHYLKVESGFCLWNIPHQLPEYILFTFVETMKEIEHSNLTWIFFYTNNASFYFPHFYFLLAYISCTKGFILMFPYIYAMYHSQIHPLSLSPSSPFLSQFQQTSQLYFHT
jgi:hypothetical protein